MQIGIKRLDHVQLTIPEGSETLARKFYNGLLGLKEIDKPEQLKPFGGVWFQAGDTQLHIGIEENFEKRKKKAHPSFVVENLNRIKVHLVQNDIEIKEETAIPGRKRFSFYDPFGNRIEFMEYEG